MDRYEPSKGQQEQIDKDRRSLKRGALIAGAVGLGGLALLKYSKGGIVHGPGYVPPRKRYGVKGDTVLGPRPPTGAERKAALGPKLGPAAPTTAERLAMAIEKPTAFGPRPPTAAERKAALGPKLGPAAPTRAERLAMAVKKPTALDNQIRKGGAIRAVKAAGLRETRAYGALKPPTQARLAKVKPADRDAYVAMDARARTVQAPALKAKEVSNTSRLKSLLKGPAAVAKRGIVTPGEAAMAVGGQKKLTRETRQAARQEIQKFRNQKNFMTPASRLIEFKSDRDRGDTARDIAVGGGALASGGAAIYAAKKFGKTSDAATAAAQTVNQTAARFTPKEIANAVGADVKAKTKKTLKGYFPTFIKGGKKVSALLRKSYFSTPASRLIEFGNSEQVRDPDSRRYNDPLKVAAGFQRGYTRKDYNNNPIVEDMPLLHAQVLKGAYNKGKKIQRTATRGGSIIKDVSDTVRGKPREKDAAGRTKKKEWEKAWFKEGAKNVATGAALVGGAAYLAKNPDKRDALSRAGRKVTGRINKVIPDLFKAFSAHEFATPASGLFGKLRGPSTAAKAAVVSRQALLEKLQSRARMGSDKAARAARSVQKNLSGKKAKVKLADRYQKDAIRSVKKGAVLAGGGALGGAALMKTHADQPEASKVERGARFRNGLVGAAAGSFLGGGLFAGKSGFKGARIGAALGGIGGLLTNPKRRVAIDELQTASFGTPAGQLIEFARIPIHAGKIKSSLGYMGNLNESAQKLVKKGSMYVADKKRGKAIGVQGHRIYTKAANLARKRAGKGIEGMSDLDYNYRLGRELRKAGSRFVKADAALQYGAVAIKKKPINLDLDFSTPASRLIEFEDGKRFAKVVKNPETGRTKTVRYGQSGKASDGKDRIRPGTSKGDAYCARSANIGGDWKSDPNSPNNLSRKKWKCSGSVSRKDMSTPASRLIEFGSTGQARLRRVAESLVKKKDLKGARVAWDKAGLKADRISRSWANQERAGLPFNGQKGSWSKYDVSRKMTKQKNSWDGLNRKVAEVRGQSWDRFVPRRPTGWNFETPASRLIHFDEVAADAGWDIRDPRGKSARVFAPGSRQRVRREKEWYEKSDNERKMWKAGVLLAGAAGLAGGHLLTKKLGKKAVMPMASPGGIGKGSKMGPRSPQRREVFRSNPGDRPKWN